MSLRTHTGDGQVEPVLGAALNSLIEFFSEVFNACCGFVE